MEPRDDDPDDLRPGTPQWDRAREERRGHPSGRHVRPHDDEGPAQVSDYLRSGRTPDLGDIMRSLSVGASPPPAPDIWKHASILVGAAGLALTVVGSSVAIVQSNTKLYDKVDGLDGRVGVLEKSRSDNLPRINDQIQSQASENKMQNDRIQSVAEALNAERMARTQDNVDSRKAYSDIMSLLSKLADKVADIDKTVAVMQGPGRRSELNAPEHDAQLATKPLAR